ncbi:MAG: hypothetical protein HYZ53_02070 [Planctomycetes bacterium]|nr:hypothetical protein [Planctomycetota bacterium]
MPAAGSPLLTMARYQPDAYASGACGAAGDTALVGLLRTILLKRFESSVRAFTKTVEKMVAEHDLFLRGLQEGVIVGKDLMHELSAADDDEVLDELLAASPNRVSAAGYDVRRLRRDVLADRKLLEGLGARAAKLGPDEDPKLSALAGELARIAAEAKKEGMDEEDSRQKRKVLVFSAYADTIDWVEDYLDRALDRNRMAVEKDEQHVEDAAGH